MEDHRAGAVDSYDAHWSKDCFAAVGSYTNSIAQDEYLCWTYELRPPTTACTSWSRGLNPHRTPLFSGA